MTTTSEPSRAPEALLRKIATLPRERVAEVEDFVDFLELRERESAADRALRRAALNGSAPSFATVWDNSEDAAYDAL